MSRPRLCALPCLAHDSFAKDFDNRFQLGRTVGSGTFGTVHVAVNRSTGQE